MIRPAVITDEISQDFERSLDVMLEYGVRDAELRGLWDVNVLDLSPAQLRRARTALDGRGMRVCGIASPIYKCDLFDSDAAAGPHPRRPAADHTLDQQLTLLERGIELCEYFNTKLIRVFAFWRQRPLDAEALRLIVAALLPGVRRAEQAGVTLGLENEHACMLGTGAEIAAALREIPSPGLRAVWDPGNAFFAGERPFPDGYQAIRDRIAHVHIKDAARDADGKPCWTVVGAGQIDFAGQLAALLQDGYQGCVSLETHYQAPGGDPEESTRLCLDGLTRLLGEAGAW